MTEQEEAEALALRLAEELTRRAALIGRDALVLSCLAHVACDPDGVRALLDEKPE